MERGGGERHWAQIGTVTADLEGNVIKRRIATALTLGALGLFAVSGIASARELQPGDDHGRHERHHRRGNDSPRVSDPRSPSVDSPSPDRGGDR